MLYKSALFLLAAFTAIKADTEPIQIDEDEVKLVEGHGFLGCGCGQNACLNPAIHYQNYQDVNVDVDEFYNFENSFPFIGPEPYSWTIEDSIGGVYNNGIFTSVDNAIVWLTRNSLVDLSESSSTYISMQADFLATGTGNLSPIDTDPYYGFGSLYTFDATGTGMELAFILTNEHVYVLYGRSNMFQTPGNNYEAFQFLIPIANVQPHSTYTLVFNKQDVVISWMIDGIIKFSVPLPGRLIDPKFLINDLGGTIQQIVFPDSVTVQMGISHLTVANPNSACQGPDSLFDYCDSRVTIYNDYIAQCEYAPVQDPTTYQVDSGMIVTMFSIVQANAMTPACSCPCAS